MSPVSVFRSALPVSAAEAFAWHEREGAFARLSPPWQPVRVLERSGGIRDGGRLVLDAGFPAGRWEAVHEGYQPGREFRDHQRGGPFARWEHVHRFLPEGARASVLEDHITWELPLAPLSGLAHGLVRERLAALFAWRHRTTRLDLAEAAARPGPRGIIGVTGASGMIGEALCAYLSTQGHEVRRFVRRPARGPAEIHWDPARGVLDPAAVAGLDAVIHLAGAGIADAPWTADRKRDLVGSRVASTRLLASALAEARGACRVLVSASAVGWHGDAGERECHESDAPGRGFLADLARDWEAAAAPARAAGLRVAHPRIGIVLWPQGGALAKLLTPFRLGAGGPLGSGRQWWGWITLPDLVSVLTATVDDAALAGPFHAVAPEPVRVSGLAAALGRVLRRPAWTPAPAFALRAALGREMADGMLLAGQQVRPESLRRVGHRFRDPELEPALRVLLGHAREAAA
jgi:hypothetical protein